MHKINVLTIGPKNFNTSIEELKDYLNFKLTTSNDNLENIILDTFDVLFVHQDFLQQNTAKNLLRKSNNIKILITHSNNPNSGYDDFNDILQMPVSVKDINQIVENSIIKKSFNKNSSIKIKSYILNKNEKKLYRDADFILLTEKEIQLLEIFLRNKRPVNKDKILNEVWKYVSDVDTHTVETHIYRLRKKIKNKFFDDDFILNYNEGYSL
jgi:DNA-binding response OmpR family regulator